MALCVYLYIFRVERNDWEKSFQTNVYRMSKFDTYIFNNLYINDYKMFWIDSGIAKLIDKIAWLVMR